jgi:hypothetical protein
LMECKTLRKRSLWALRVWKRQGDGSRAIGCYCKVTEQRVVCLQQQSLPWMVNLAPDGDSFWE